MAGSTHNAINILEEKEAAKAVQIEDVAGAANGGYDPAELEPRMNLQTCLAFLVGFCLIIIRLEFEELTRTGHCVAV